MYRKLLLVSFAIIMCATSAMASSNYIETIEINGLERVERETVLSYANVKTDMSFSQRELDYALKSLYGIGLFEDVSIYLNGSKMTINVVENPLINKRNFEGNNKVADKLLETEVRLKSGSMYNKAALQEDVLRILEVYKKSGRYAAVVVPKIIKRDQNRIDLVFEIKEGPKATIRKINFIGNRHYSGSDLKNEIMSKENAWYRFLSSADTYDSDKTNYDKELLRRFYMKRGYVDFNVVSAVGELAPNKKSFTLNFVIDEGERYKVSDINISSELHGVNVEPLYDVLEVKKGEWYNIDTIDSSINKIVDELGVAGFAFVDVVPDYDKNEKNSTLKLKFKILEGERIFINKINIKGNDRTEDKVIRREVRLNEGDAFNGSKIRTTRRNIERLNYFSKVDIKTDPKENDAADLEIELEEKSTGSFNFGVGYSTVNGPMVQAGISENNFQGKGQYLGFDASISEKYNSYELSFTEPYFLDRSLSAGFDLFRSEQNYQDEGSYNEDVTGGRVRFGWRYTDNLTHHFRYTLRQDEIKNVSRSASVYIQQEAGTYIGSIVGQGLTYDRRDSTTMTKDGYLLSIDNDIAGAGGDEKYIQFDARAYHFTTFADKYTLKTFINGGYIFGYDGKDVRLSNRYNLGGYTLRGFRSSGIGARDKFTDDSLGGNWMLYGGAELSFPLGLEEVGIRGKTFFDVGMLGKPDNYNKNIVDYSDKVRTSAGVGVTWLSPMGQIDLDFGFAINKEKYDKTEVFRLNFGTRL